MPNNILFVLSVAMPAPALVGLLIAHGGGRITGAQSAALVLDPIASAFFGWMTVVKPDHHPILQPRQRGRAPIVDIPATDSGINFSEGIASIFSTRKGCGWPRKRKKLDAKNNRHVFAMEKLLCTHTPGLRARKAAEQR